MRSEIELVRLQQEKHGLPVRDTPPEGRAPFDELMSRRRLLRVELDDFIRTLVHNDVVDFSIRLGRIAFAVAGTCAQFGCEPEFAHYAEAVKGVIEDAQRELDKALQVSDWHGVRVAAAKLQLLWYGTAANLGMPYGPMLKLLHDKYIAGEDIDKEQVKELLRAAGMHVEDEKPHEGAANDEEKP